MVKSDAANWIRKHEKTGRPFGETKVVRNLVFGQKKVPDPFPSRKRFLTPFPALSDPFSLASLKAMPGERGLGGGRGQS